MPNWIINEVEVTGSREAIDRAAALIADEGKVDFNRVHPMPEKFISHPNEVHVGYPNGNVWALAEWGTKWNAQDSGKIKTAASDGSIGWYFSSAWSAPEAWFHALLAKLKAEDISVSITLTYADPMEWAGGWIECDTLGVVTQGNMRRKEVTKFLGQDQ